MHKKILFLSVIIAFSCTKNQHFDQFGISFSYPNDWTVTDAEKLGDDYLISVDKNGESIVDIIVSAKENQVQMALESQLISQSEGVVRSVYGKYPCISRLAQVNMLNIPFQTRTVAFSVNGLNISLEEFVAVEQIAETQAAFDMIEESFSVKDQ